MFERIKVSKEVSPRGQHYIRMRLLSGLQPFFCDIPMNRRGLKRCHLLAEKLGLPMDINDEALAAMETNE